MSKRIYHNETIKNRKATSLYFGCWFMAGDNGILLAVDIQTMKGIEPMQINKVCKNKKHVFYMSDKEKSFVAELSDLLEKYDVGIHTEEDEDSEGNLYLAGYRISGRAIGVDIGDLKDAIKLKLIERAV